MSYQDTYSDLYGDVVVVEELEGVSAGTATVGSPPLAVVRTVVGGAVGGSEAVGSLTVSAGIVTLAGTSAGGSTAAGSTLSRRFAIAGTSAGGATSTGTLSTSLPGPELLSGTISGATSSAVGALVVDRVLAGSSAGDSTASATLRVRQRVIDELVGDMVIGRATVAPATLRTSRTTHELAGAIEGESTVPAADLDVEPATIRLSGSSAGDSTASAGLLSRSFPLGSATSEGLSRAFGALVKQGQVFRTLGGLVRGRATVASAPLAVISPVVSLSGSSAGASTVSSPSLTTAGNVERLTGRSGGVGIARGGLTVTKPPPVTLIATATGSATASALPPETVAPPPKLMVGNTVASLATFVGALTVADPPPVELEVTAAGTATASGSADVLLVVELVGASTGATTGIGTLVKSGRRRVSHAIGFGPRRSDTIFGRRRQGKPQ